MATSVTNVVSSSVTKTYIGTADDAKGTYTTGDISNLIKNVSMNITSNTSDETALDAAVGQTHKDINDISVTITWKTTKTARNRAIEYVNQDSSKEYPLRISFDGIATGETYYAGTGVFTGADPSSTAKTAQSISSQFMFNDWEIGTHA